MIIQNDNKKNRYAMQYMKEYAISRPKGKSMLKKQSSGVQSQIDENRQLFTLNSMCGNYIYHLGIIDYLQPWNTTKKVETFFKTKIKGIPSMDVSSIRPHIYGDRFLNYMQNKVFTDNKDIASQYKEEFVNHLNTTQGDSKIDES